MDTGMDLSAVEGNAIAGLIYAALLMVNAALLLADAVAIWQYVAGAR